MLKTPRILNLLFSVIFLSSMGFTQDFSASMAVAGGTSEYGLTFGFNPNATDGYDTDYDQYAPPAPPPPAFDAALSWGGDRYYTQILAGDGNLTEHIYDIALEELNQKKIPFILKRFMNNKYEYWKLEDLIN